MKYCFWLSNLVCLNNVKKIRLVENGFTAKEIYYSSKERLISTGLLTDKDICNIISHRQNFEVDMEWAKFQMKNINFVTFEQKEYPSRLKNIPNNPYCLFYIGSLPEENEKTVAIVGARERSLYGKEIATMISKELTKANFSVVSGLARGIDRDAHYGALETSGNTYAVLGSGVDVCYPTQNRYLYDRIIKDKKCGIISENPPGTKAKAYLFPLRNRIISGLSDFTIIVEAREKSGSLISADYSMEQGKDVYVVPGRISDSLSYGCNKLISQGANILFSIEDLLKSLNISSDYNVLNSNIKKNLLEKDEALVYSLLDFRPIGLSYLMEEINIDLHRLLEIIDSLEKKGYISEVVPNYFARIL